jgi:hypothetical protein
MIAWLINPPSSGTLAFSLRLASSLPDADFPAFHTGYSASPPLADSPFPGASSAILPPYCLLRHFGFLTSPHAYHTCNKRPFTSLRLVRSFTDHPSVAWAHLLQLPTTPLPLVSYPRLRSDEAPQTAHDIWELWTAGASHAGDSFSLSL